MNVSKLNFSFLFLVFSALSLGASWKITETKREFKAVNPTFPGIELVLHSSGGIPKIKEWKTINKQISTLYYDSGTAGTSTLVRAFRGIIVDVKNKKVLGEAPWKYEVVSGEQTFTQPTWSWGKNSLKVVDVEFSENLELNW